MNKLIITSTALMLCGNAFAYGEAGRWSSGWGQGTSEYTAVVNQQKTSISPVMTPAKSA
ncbi:hypothetical protein RIMD111065_33530 [Aeromonas hydrophila]|nr:hypothetical protein [Aeromonas hydrophila]BCO14997.1 hypothetical protein RIMD111065_33530 [Aeromonas hydrophila]